jgi:hypothetical protein
MKVSLLLYSPRFGSLLISSLSTTVSSRTGRTFKLCYKAQEVRPHCFETCNKSVGQLQWCKAGVGNLFMLEGRINLAVIK